MKNGLTIFKYLTPIICTIIVVWFLRDLKCNGNGGEKEVVKIRVDTFWKKGDTVVRYVPQPYKVTTHSIDTFLLEHDIPFFTFDSLPQSIKNILSEYNNKKYYADSFAVQYGKLYLYDTVRYSRIVGKGFALNQSIPEITNTITLREKPRMVVYAGLTVMGNKTTPIFATGAKIGFMAKNGKYYGGSYLISKTGSDLYQFETLLPIRLRKK